MESTNWKLIPSREPAVVSDGRLRLLPAVVHRNIDGARRRWSRLQVSPIAEELGPISSPGGTFLQVPALPSGALSSRLPLGSFESSSDSEDASVSGRRPLGGRTPKRPGGDLDAPTSQRPRTDSQLARDAGGEEIRERHQFPTWKSTESVAVTDDVLQNAMLSSLAGWPSYEVMFPMGYPSRSVDHTTLVVDSEGMPPSKTFFRNGREDPLSVSAQAPGVQMALPRDFRMVGAEGGLESPPSPT